MKFHEISAAEISVTDFTPGIGSNGWGLRLNSFRAVFSLGVIRHWFSSNFLCSTVESSNLFARQPACCRILFSALMCHARTVHALLFLILGARLLGGRVRCRVCSQRGKTAPARPPCPCRARDAQQCTSACCLVFLRSRPPVPCRVRWVRCVWVWGWV